MSDTDFETVKLRAEYEHFKSTPEEPRTYVTLGAFVLEDEVFIEYYEVDGPGFVIHKREINEFYDTILKDGEHIPRFTLLDENVITPEGRDQIRDIYSNAHF